MKESMILSGAIRHKQKERDELQRAVDEFHARGGKTQHFEPGESSGSSLNDFAQAHQRRKKR